MQFCFACGLFVFRHLILYQSKVSLLSLYHLLDFVLFLGGALTKSSETREKNVATRLSPHSCHPALEPTSTSSQLFCRP